MADLLTGPIEELGCKLYDVEYSKEAKSYFLRIYIDKKEGICLEDCEKVSNSITDLLDQADYIEEQYFLEVSSPGIERILRKEKHLQENTGQEIQVKLFQPIEKQKQYTGKLLEFDKNILKLEIDGTILSLERKNIAQIKTVYHW